MSRNVEDAPRTRRNAMRMKFEPITIKEPHKYDVKTFEDSDDFTAYYRQHEDDFKGVSTAILNRTYKIPGYRISVVGRGTDNEELILKKDYYGTTRKMETEVTNDYSEQIAVIMRRLDNIEQYLQHIA